MFLINKFLILSILLTTSYYYVNAAESKKPYKAPCNTKYPHGDEKQFNTNVLENDTNKVHCADQKDMKDLEGKCPLGEPSGAVVDPYVSCPAYDVFPPVNEIIFSSNQKESPEVQCKKCDLRLTADNTGVIVECFQCYDIPSTNREANRKKYSV